MKKHGKLLIALVTVLTSLAFADVESDIRDLELKKEKLNSDIQKLETQISETESLVKEDDKRKVVLEERYKKDSERRKSEIDSLNAKIKSVANALQAERNAQASAKGRTENVKAKRKAMRAALAKISETFEAQVASTLPWERETRLDRVRALTRDIKSGNASEEEAFSRLKSLIAEETKFGDEVAVINAPFTRKDGELINARILRIGNQWMVYSDENGNLFGSLVRKIENGEVVYEWNEDLNLAERAAISTALDVKQAKKPPQIVTLPISLSIVRQAD